MKRGFAFALVLGLALSGAAAQVIKLGTTAPDNSPWGMGLKRMVAEWKRISGGKVDLKVYAGTIGDEENILQKMRFGLDAGVFSTSGLSKIYEDVMALSIPSLIRTEAELESVLLRIDAPLRKSLADRGFVVGAWSKGGWIYFFSKRPVSKPEDMIGMKVAVPPGDVKLSTMLKSIGAITVPIGLSELIPQLGSGGVEAFFASPLIVSAQWSFFKGYNMYMSDLRISPFVGALLITQKAWDRVPAASRPAMLDSAATIARDVAAEVNRMETTAIASMLKDGLRLAPITPADLKAWNEIFVVQRDRYVKGLFSDSILSLIDAAVASQRK